MQESSTRPQLSQPLLPEAVDPDAELWSDFSHEIRTPLNSIIGFAELLHDGKVGVLTAAQRECIGDILASSQHLQSLLDDLLVLARIDSGWLQPRVEPIDLVTFIDEVCTDFRARRDDFPLQLRGDVAGDLRTIRGDRGLLAKLLRHLLGQAAALNRSGSALIVRTRATGDIALQIDVVGDRITAEAAQQRWAEIAIPMPTHERRRRSGLLGLVLAARIGTALGGLVAPREAQEGDGGFRLTLPLPLPCDKPR